MADEYALQEFLAAHGDQAIVTTSWMTQRSANFFSNRHLPRIDPAEVDISESIVIRDRALEDFDTTALPTLGAGRYVVVDPDVMQEPSSR